MQDTGESGLGPTLSKLSHHRVGSRAENQKEKVRVEKANAGIASRKLLQFSVAGAIAFWITSIASSMLPIAAEYRAAYSNWSIQTVWIASLPSGMIIAGCVSYCLLRCYMAIPTNDPVLKSVIVSSVALVIGIVLIDVPMSLNDSIHSGRYFVIGAAFNAARYLLLGLAIGQVYKMMNGPMPVEPDASQRR